MRATLVTAAVLLSAVALCWLAVRALVRPRRAAGPVRLPWERGPLQQRLPQPGEIWWAVVPFRETDGAKRRPCLVLGADGRDIDVLKITSQDKSHRHDHIEIPSRRWDRRATKNSFLDLAEPFRLRIGDFRKRAGVVDPETWRRVGQRYPVGAAPTGHEPGGWPHPYPPPGPAGYAYPPPQPMVVVVPSGYPGAAVNSTTSVWASFLAVAGLFTCGLTAPFGAILGHVARAEIRRTGKWGDDRAIRAIALGWTLTAVMGLGWWCCLGGQLPYLERITGGVTATEENGTPLYTLPVTLSGVSQSGQRLDSTLGGRRYRDSTGVRLCGDDGRPTLTYRLAGGYRRLTATAGLEPHTPAGLTTRITVLGDGRTLATVTVTRDTTAAIDVDLTGVQTLAVTAVVVKGACGASLRPYGSLGDARLLR